jgi:hypothetical protein
LIADNGKVSVKFVQKGGSQHIVSVLFRLGDDFNLNKPAKESSGGLNISRHRNIFRERR